jgi:hypothetical protein
MNEYMYVCVSVEDLTYFLTVLFTTVELSADDMLALSFSNSDDSRISRLFRLDYTVTYHCCRPTKRWTTDLSTADCQHAHWRSLEASEEDTETTAARSVSQASATTGALVGGRRCCCCCSSNSSSSRNLNETRNTVD